MEEPHIIVLESKFKNKSGEKQKEMRIRKIFLKIILFTFYPSFLMASDFTEEAFVPGFEDIPLMTGMTYPEDGTISFDSPEGRFIQVYMNSSDNFSRENIEGFYSESLPSLGWQRLKGSKNNCYFRDDEQLCIDISGKNAPFVVRFELKTIER